MSKDTPEVGDVWKYQDEIKVYLITVDEETVKFLRF